MAHRKTSKQSKARTRLQLADLEQSKNAVLHSLGAASSQESYGHAIDEFIGWYCTEPRLSFNRTVVLRYRFFLEQKNLAPSTINVCLAAVTRLAYGTERIGSKKNNLRGERRSSGSRASHRSRYGRFSCTDLKFSRSIQFSQSRMVSGSSAPRRAVALTNVSSTFIASKTSLSSSMSSSARPGLSGMSTSRVKGWPVI